MMGLIEEGQETMDEGAEKEETAACRVSDRVGCGESRGGRMVPAEVAVRRRSMKDLRRGGVTQAFASGCLASTQNKGIAIADETYGSEEVGTGMVFTQDQILRTL